MYVNQEFKIGFRDIDKNYKATNKAILGFFEDTAGTHSSLVGYGLKDVSKTNLTWFLISWKVKILKRPDYEDKLNVTTWSKTKNKLYAFRNFESYNQNNEKIAIASSKWVPIDIQTGSIMKLTDEIFDKYESENKTIFEDEEKYKLKEPENYSIKKEYKITRNMIDMLNHVHNTYYLDFVYEILPEEFFNKEFNEFEILYKKQITYNETVKILYSKIEEEHFIVIKSYDESTLHAIIKLK